MGQYYLIAVKEEDKPVAVYKPKTDKDQWVGLKLLEHGYLCTNVCKAVGKLLSGRPVQIAWCGDYSDEDGDYDCANGDLKYDMVWGEDVIERILKSARFGWKGKYLVNVTKKEYISFDKYFKNCEKAGVEKGWEICPFTVLTAIGNGRGGGDYSGVNEELAGTWAWDAICISGKKPTDCKELDICFKEGL